MSSRSTISGDNAADKKFVLNIEKLLAKEATMEALILRGHLVIEDLLRQLLAAHSVKPEFLKDARLTFFQALRLAQAIDGGGLRDQLFARLELLNRIRNTLAHEMDSPRQSEQILEFVLRSEPRYRGGRRPKPRPFLKRLGVALVMNCAILHGLAQIRTPGPNPGPN